jgi:hypothetical protein
VLKGVAGDLPAEAAKFGADRGEVGAYQLGEAAGQLRCGGEPAAGAVDHVEGQHVVGGPAVGDRVRPAGIVADHAAHGAAGMGGRVRTEAQPVRAGRCLEAVEHDAGFDDRAAALGVDGADPGQVATGVQHDAGTHRVAGHRGTAATEGHRRPGATGDLHGRDDVVGVTGKDHHPGYHPVVRRVGGVLRQPQGGGAHLAADLPAEQVEQVGGFGGVGHRGASWGAGPP